MGSAKAALHAPVTDMLDMFPANRIIHQAFGDLQGNKGSARRCQ